MTLVLANTDQLRSLAPDLADRRASGLDHFDEWWDGVYRSVTGPGVPHQEAVICLAIFLRAWRSRGLRVVQGVNVGIDKVDCRVPDVSVFRFDTPLTSPAFLSTVELAVEVLSPGEVPGAQLPFLARWNVREYLEVDPRLGTGRLLRRVGNRWVPARASRVLDVAVEDGHLVAGDERLGLRFDG